MSMNKNDSTPLGSLRFKIRMRKPVSEAIRYFREKNEIENMKAFETGRVGDGSSVGMHSRKKLITVQIVGCKDL